MLRITLRIMFALVALALPTMSAVWAQHPLEGDFLEEQLGMLLQFRQGADGALEGVVVGPEELIPMTLITEGRVLQGSFVLAGQGLGVYGELLEDDVSFAFMLYFLDAAGQPVPGSEEEFVAVRQGQSPGREAATLFPPSPSQVPQAPPVAPQVLPAPPEVPQVPQASPAAPGAAQQPPAAPLSPAPPLPSVGAGAAASPGAGAQLFGRWSATAALGGGVLLRILLDLSPDGTYRHEVHDLARGEFLAFEEGRFEMAGEGLLTLVPTHGSEELCFLDECVAVELEFTEYAVAFLEGGMLHLTERSGEAGPLTELAYERRE